MEEHDGSRLPGTDDRVGGPARRISLAVSDDVLQEDLEALRKKAIEMGAGMAEIVPASWVEVDERVRLKCFVPMCGYYGRNPYCPPRAPELSFIRSAFSRYRRAILLALEVVPPTAFSVRSPGQKAAHSWARRNMEIVGRLETMALGNGYYLAAAFSQLSCLASLCDPETGCQVLQGRRCAHALRSRPSLESMGVDVFRLVARVGWDIYPIYRSVDPGAVRGALSVGLLLVC